MQICENFIFSNTAQPQSRAGKGRFAPNPPSWIHHCVLPIIPKHETYYSYIILAVYVYLFIGSGYGTKIICIEDLFFTQSITLPTQNQLSDDTIETNCNCVELFKQKLALIM